MTKKEGGGLWKKKYLLQMFSVIQLTMARASELMYLSRVALCVAPGATILSA
jgi:hypothetical protein